MNPPPIIPYHQPTTPPPPLKGTAYPVRQFLLGLIGGGVLSAICWGLIFSSSTDRTPSATNSEPSGAVAT